MTMNKKTITLIGALLAGVSMTSIANTSDHVAATGYDLIQDINKLGVIVHFDKSDKKVLNAIQRGQIKPLSALYAAVDKEIYGQIKSVELDKDDGQWTYDVTLINNNQLVEVEYDAMTLRPQELKGKNIIDAIKF